MADDFDVDAFLDGYKPTVVSVQICQRNDLHAEHARLEAELAEASRGDDMEAPKRIAQQIVETQTQIAEATKTFTFQSIPRDQWYELIVKNPPSDEEAQETPGAVVGKQFQDRAIAACSVSPKLTEAQAKRMRQMRPADFDRVWVAVSQACETEVVAAPKSGLATAVLALYEKSSTTSGRKASRGRRSPAGAARASQPTSTTKKAG